MDRILHEEAYIGTYYYNRKHCVPIEGAYGKKRQRFKCTLRPKEEWIPISVPPIIDLASVPPRTHPQPYLALPNCLISHNATYGPRSGDEACTGVFGPAVNDIADCSRAEEREQRQFPGAS